MKLILASAILVSCIKFVYSVSLSTVSCSYRTSQACYDAINKGEDSDFFIQEVNEFGFITFYSKGCGTFRSDLIKIKGCERCNPRYVGINPNAFICKESGGDAPE